MNIDLLLVVANYLQTIARVYTLSGGVLFVASKRKEPISQKLDFDKSLTK
jgi:hypothetical protein